MQSIFKMFVQILFDVRLESSEMEQLCPVKRSPLVQALENKAIIIILFENSYDVNLLMVSEIGPCVSWRKMPSCPRKITGLCLALVRWQQCWDESRGSLLTVHFCPLKQQWKKPSGSEPFHSRLTDHSSVETWRDHSCEEDRMTAGMFGFVK